LAGDKPIFLSYRACVENYLLDPELIREYWDESSTGPNWRHGASPSVNAIDEWLDAAARDIAHYQATRWALAGVKPDARWPEVSTTWTKGSGHLPADLDADSCLDRARRLVDQYAAQTDTVSRERLETFFGQYDRQFSDEAFFGQKAYLVWFHGKDLQRAMGRLQPKWISLPSFFPWAVAHISEESFDDLVELKTILST
jgi:hypothetical protein